MNKDLQLMLPVVLSAWPANREANMADNVHGFASVWELAFRLPGDDIIKDENLILNHKEY